MSETMYQLVTHAAKRRCDSFVIAPGGQAM